MPEHPTKLTDFIPAGVLQRILDSFTAVTGYPAAIADRDGKVLAEAEAEGAALTADLALQQTLALHGGRHHLPVAPIEVSGQRIGTMTLRAGATAQPAMAGGGGGPAEPMDLAEAARRGEALRLLYLLSDTIAQMCRQGMALRRRVDELTTLVDLATLLSSQRDLDKVLDTICRSVVDLMNVKAAAIRLLSDDGDTLVVAAVHNLSQQYLDKGPIRLSRSLLDQQVLAGEVGYVEDMASDPRVLYPEDAVREGVASILCVGMIWAGRPVGIMRLYTAQVRPFNDDEKDLLQAIAQLAGAVIRNAQLNKQQEENQRIRQQVNWAAQVQRQLLPQSPPVFPPFDVAGRYEPCFELGGDFYDFIPLENSLGFVVGDVVGKGVGASLLMASVRASLRAHVEDIYDIDEVMARVNTALARDTRDREFATVIYGTLDRQLMRLTYCSAGHDPGMLYRNGEFQDLEVGGMVLGVDAGQRYDKGLVQLYPGDVMLFFTDGVTDASNFNGEKFGRERVQAAIRETAHMAARDVVNHVLWQVRRFVGLNYRPDDMTLVAIKVLSAES